MNFDQRCVLFIGTVVFIVCGGLFLADLLQGVKLFVLWIMIMAVLASCWKLFADGKV